MTYPMPLYAEPAARTVIAWQQRFCANGPAYNYVAISVPGRGWFVSDRYDKAYSWEELCWRYIRNSPVLVATGWAPLPTQIGGLR